MSQPTPNPPAATTSSAAPAQPATRRKPRVSLAIATALGLGYIPKAPGTFGSLAGIALALSPLWPKVLGAEEIHFNGQPYSDPFVGLQIALTIGLAFVGVITAHRAAKWWNAKDPQRVVIDEVSGQHLALLLGGFWPRRAVPPTNLLNLLHLGHAVRWAGHPLGADLWGSPNWKYLLVGFILFRVFDIWKPFPARQAESLPGGLGIMADDWIAGVYAALGLWILRAFGL
jgi:phosphatidylglycerophosphatase A